MGKLQTYMPVLKAKITIMILGTAFYLGAQFHDTVERVENYIFRGDVPYAALSHSGSLDIEDQENEKGELEKKLVNLGTDETIFTIQKDYLPSTEYILPVLAQRAENSPQERDSILRFIPKNQPEAETSWTPYYILGGTTVLLTLAGLHHKRKKSGGLYGGK